MNAKPELKPAPALRILSDAASVGALAAGGFLAASAPLIGSGWQPRPSNGEAGTMALHVASSITWSLGPIVAAALGVLLLLTGTGSFLIRRPHNVRWLAISLACGAAVAVGDGLRWLDAGIVLLCVAGWASQFFPSRELVET